ncbi:MAG: hypothetical protein ACJART_001661 [Maribacter sp.]|jgi:hypothetical protein|tara:strand:- start:380 stop:514 length:135 start_codon:yes stop_codon:yes gene_type:complete
MKNKLMPTRCIINGRNSQHATKDTDHTAIVSDKQKKDLEPNENN